MAFCHDGLCLLKKAAMMSNNETGPEALIELTADVVSAYVSNNSVSAADLPQLIAAIHVALGSLGRAAAAPEPEKQKPAVPVSKSITPDYLISLENGKRFKMLKLHLRSVGLTPDTYRTKWGLPSTYPMIAPDYARKRSDFAISSGFGQKRAEPVPTPEPEPAPVPAKRGRSKTA